MTYLVIFLLLSFLGVYFYYNETQLNYFFVCKILAFVVFVYLAGMRYEIGVDYFAYSDHFLSEMNLFDFLEKGWPRSNYQPGYILYSMFVRTLTDNPQWLFFSASVFCTSTLFFVLTKLTEKKYFFLSLLTYFSFVYLLLELQALRQSLAAAFSYVAWYFLIKKKFAGTIIFAFLAIMFHSSAIFLVPIFILANMSISKKIQISLIVLSSLIMIFHVRWIDGFSNFLSSLIPSFAGVAKFAMYAEGSQNERGIFALYFIFVAIYLFLLYRKFLCENLYTSKKMLLFQNIYLFFLIATSLFWEVNYISTRLGWYLFLGFVLMLPYIMECLVFFRPVFAIIALVFICFIPTRHFIWPDDTTIMFSPYEDYVQCKILEDECSGRTRAIIYAKRVGAYFKY